MVTDTAVTENRDKTRKLLAAIQFICTRVWPKIFRLERELQMVQLSATRCSRIAILWVSLASFDAITLCVASQRVFIVAAVISLSTQSGNFWIHHRTVIFTWTSRDLLSYNRTNANRTSDEMRGNFERWIRRSTVETKTRISFLYGC
jgi:hypothetical protein